MDWWQKRPNQDLSSQSWWRIIGAAFLLTVTGGLAYFLWKRPRNLKIIGLKRRKNLPFSYTVRQIGRRSWWRKVLTKDQNTIATVALIGFFSFGFLYFFDDYAHFFQANIFQKSVVFDGTTFPVKEVPNWSQLTTAERTMAYTQIPRTKFIDIPDYEPSIFSAGKEWKPDNENARNAYITYPVPNLGNYHLDGQENGGSHPGIDIKIPIGTPIHSIANGIIYKVDFQSTGYGHHIVVKHPNVKDPETGKLVTLYAGYAHLSKTNVKTGEIVKKNQIIGLSGDTGMATAPHLHFQIDREGAPFFPYWPFSWSDLKAQGIRSYFDGVNNAVGIAKAKLHTVHPVNFIAKYEDYESDTIVVSADDLEPVVETEPENPAENIEPVVSEKPKLTINDAKAVVAKPKTPTPVQRRTSPYQKSSSPSKVLSIKTDRVFIPGKTKTVTLEAIDPSLIAGDIDIASTLKHLAEIEPRKISAENFVDGKAEIEVRTDSDNMFRLVATGDFGEVKSASIWPQLFTDIDRNYAEKDAIAYVKNERIFTGFDDGSFGPNQNMTRAQAAKTILVANDVAPSVGHAGFSDVASDSWFAPYVAKGVESGYFSGYADNQFRPASKISVAEFLKVALKAAKISAENPTESPYPDVSTDAWFASDFNYARQHDLIKLKKGGFAVPHRAITRSEAAYILWKLAEGNTENVT